MAPEKGAREAIEVARRAGVLLVMAAKCREPDEIAYFESAVAPHIGHGVVWLGEIGPEEKFALLGGARGTGVPDQLARAVRNGHDRGHGLWHPRARDAMRLRAGGRAPRVCPA